MTAGPRGLDAPDAAPDLIVREMRWSDFDDLREAYYLLYEERETQPDIGITLFRTKPSYEDEVRWFTGTYGHVLAGDWVAAVAERAGHAVGHAVVRRVGASPESEMAHVGELGILVHRDHRGQGVGRALLTRVLAQSRGKFGVIRLSVFTRNVRARRLYEQFGFVFVGRLPRAIRRGTQELDEDLMVLELDRRDANR